MKKVIVVILCGYLLSSCSIFKGSTKTGCPSNGKNVGAEKILSGEKVPKARKFKA